MKNKNPKLIKINEEYLKGFVRFDEDNIYKISNNKSFVEIITKCLVKDQEECDYITYKIMGYLIKEGLVNDSENLKYLMNYPKNSPIAKNFK